MVDDEWPRNRCTMSRQNQDFRSVLVQRIIHDHGPMDRFTDDTELRTVRKTDREIAVIARR